VVAELTGIPGNPSSRVQSVDRAVDLLRSVAAATGSDASVATLAKHSGLNRATAWRILTTLEAQGMVSRDPHTGWFVLGPTFVELAALGGGGQDVLLERAQPVLERLSLETGETACLGIIEGDRISYAAEAIPDIADEESWLGEPVVLHACSMGKAFLAHLDPARLESVLTLPLARYTDSTITDLDVLRKDLALTRRRGHALCRGELEEDSWGVAATVFGAHGKPVAVLCLWGPDHRGGPDRFDALGRLARSAARSLSGIA
jgi:DNA-binding IclR family transcriptional regulator